MLHSSHPLDRSETWDTNWARKFLKIPQDQLNRINNIPEWSINKILTSASSGVHIATAEKEPLLQSATVLEKLSQSNSSTNSIDNLKVSDLLQNIENKLTRSASLNYLNLFDKPSEHTGLRSANSAPNIKKLLLSSNNLASVENHTISVTNSQKYKFSKLSRFKFNPTEILEDTHIVSSKFNKMDFCSTSFSQPEMSYESSPKIGKPLEKLTNRILNHKYLKESMNTDKSDETGLSMMSVQGGNEQNVTDKRLMLLEKRFSSEECTSAENSKILELSKPIFQAPKDAELQEQGCVSISKSSAGDVLNADHIQGSSALVQESDRDEKKDVSNYKHSSSISHFVVPKVPNKNESNTTSINHEDSFGSQLIPCGQPLPKEANSCSQPKSSKNANIETPGVSTDITNAAQSTVAENLNIQNSPLVHVKSSGIKRKRKSKGEIPKRIKDVKHTHEINFTADQVRNMLEMIKMFHSSET